MKPNKNTYKAYNINNYIIERGDFYFILVPVYLFY